LSQPSEVIIRWYDPEFATLCSQNGCWLEFFICLCNHNVFVTLAHMEVVLMIIPFAVGGAILAAIAGGVALKQTRIFEKPANHPNLLRSSIATVFHK